MTDANPDAGPDDLAEGRRTPNGQPHERGWREGDPDADSIMPAREVGAGGGVDDGPNEAEADPIGAPTPPD